MKIINKTMIKKRKLTIEEKKRKKDYINKNIEHKDHLKKKQQENKKQTEYNKNFREQRSPERIQQDNKKQTEYNKNFKEQRSPEKNTKKTNRIYNKV